MDKNQKMRYSEAEKALIKKTFQNEQVLYALRNLFWQLDLSEGEKKVLNFEADQLKIVKKVLLPDIEREVPLGQQVDFTNDPLLLQLSQMNPALACIMMDANDLRVEYLQQQFLKLVTGDFKENKDSDIILADLKAKQGVDQDEIRHVHMLAYKSIKDYIDGRIFELEYIANPPVELTEEEKKVKTAKNSTK